MPPTEDVTTPLNARSERLPTGRLRLTLDWNRPRRRVSVLRTGAALLAAAALLATVAWALDTIAMTGFLVILGGAFALLAGGTLALLTARTKIDVDDEVIAVRHRRYFLPWHRRHATGDLAQIFCLRSRRRGPGRYHLAALDRDGGRRIVVPHLDHLRDARFLEREMESRLAITDRGVRGEVADPVVPEVGAETFTPRTRWGMKLASFRSSSSGGRYKPGKWDELLFKWRSRE